MRIIFYIKSYRLRRGRRFDFSSGPCLSGTCKTRGPTAGRFWCAISTFCGPCASLPFGCFSSRPTSVWKVLSACPPSAKRPATKSMRNYSEVNCFKKRTDLQKNVLSLSCQYLLIHLHTYGKHREICTLVGAKQ